MKIKEKILEIISKFPIILVIPYLLILLGSIYCGYKFFDEKDNVLYLILGVIGICIAFIMSRYFDKLFKRNKIAKKKKIDYVS